MGLVLDLCNWELTIEDEDLVLPDCCTLRSESLRFRGTQTVSAQSFLFVQWQTVWCPSSLADRVLILFFCSIHTILYHLYAILSASAKELQRADKILDTVDA